MNFSTKQKSYQQHPIQPSSRLASKIQKQQPAFMFSSGTKSKKQVELGSSRHIKDDRIDNGLGNFPKFDLKIGRVDSKYKSKIGEVGREDRRGDEASVQHKDRLLDRSRERMYGSGIGRPYVRGIQSQSRISDGLQSEERKSGVHQSYREVFEDYADSRSDRNRLSKNGKYSTYRRQGSSPSYLKNSPRSSSKNLNESLGEDIDHSSGYNLNGVPRMISSVGSQNTEMVTSGMSVKNKAYLKPMNMVKSLEEEEEESKAKGIEVLRKENQMSTYESQIKELEKQNRNQSLIINRLETQLSSFKSNFLSWEKENALKQKQIDENKALIQELKRDAKAKETVQRTNNEQVERLEESKKQNKQWDRRLNEQKQIQQDEFQIRLKQQRNKVENILRKQFDIQIQERKASQNELLIAVQNKQQQIEKLNEQLVKQSVNTQNLSKLSQELSNSKHIIGDLTKNLHTKQTKIASLTLSLQNAQKSLRETQSKNHNQKQGEKTQRQYQKLIAQHKEEKRILDQDRREVTRLYIEVEKDKKHIENINALYKEGEKKLAECQAKLTEYQKNLAEETRLEEERKMIIQRNSDLERENQSLQKIHQKMSKIEQENTFLKQQNLQFSEQKEQKSQQKYEALQSQYSILLQKLQIKQAEVLHKQQDYKKLKKLYEDKAEGDKNLDRGTLKKIQDLQARLIESEGRLKGLLAKIQGEEDMVGRIMARMEDGWEGYQVALGKLQAQNEILYTKYLNAKKNTKKQGKKDDSVEIEQKQGLDNGSYRQFLQKEIWSYFNRIVIPGFETKVKNKIGEMETKMIEKNKKIQQIRYRLKEIKNRKNRNNMTRIDSK